MFLHPYRGARKIMMLDNKRLTKSSNSFRMYLNRIRLNIYLRLGFVLGIIQFLVYLSRFDNLLTLGPFVTHHFIELPAFYCFGVGFSILFYDMEFTHIQAYGLNFLIFTLNIFQFSGVDLNGILAAFIVSMPELIGFFYHRCMTLNQGKKIIQLTLDEIIS